MTRASAPEEKVAQLADPGRIRAHFVDEFRVNELFELAASGRELVFRWQRMPNVERRRFVFERDEVLKRADALVSRPVETLSPLVKEDFQKARAEWLAVRDGLAALPL